MEDNAKKRPVRKLIAAIIGVLIAAVMMTVPVYAWFGLRKTLASYAPIANPEALYIGAGHRNYDEASHRFTDTDFEDIRYLYLEGIDAEEEDVEYYDYVFCVYGRSVSQYRLQLAYTTNNQFTYDIFPATESTSISSSAIEHTVHYSPFTTYYYTVSSGAIAGDFLNEQTVGSESIATNAKHTETYNSYSRVQKYAEPLYWQTSSPIITNTTGDFIHYYILRVNLNGKSVNDRETDIICIAAKTG